MKSVAGLCLLFASCVCHGDRLFSIPTAQKVPFGQMRLELDSGWDGKYSEEYADLGIGKSMELGLRYLHPMEDNAAGTFDFNYNLISALPGFTPGISVGVQDAVNETPDGRRFFFALTSRDIYSVPGGDSSGSVTLGVFAGAHSSAYVGFDLPLTHTFRFLLEHNGYRISAGCELKPSDSIGVRFYFRGAQPVAAFTTTTRF